MITTVAVTVEKKTTSLCCLKYLSLPHLVCPFTRPYSVITVHTSADLRAFVSIIWIVTVGHLPPGKIYVVNYTFEGEGSHYKFTTLML